MNNAIQKAFFQLVEALPFDYPIAWPGVNFDPEDPNEFNDEGIWLEVRFLPNEGLNPGLSSGSVIPQGMLQINVSGRPGKGIVRLTELAEEIQGRFAQGQLITGTVRVQRTPYQMQRIDMDDRIIIPVTIPYSG